MYTVFVATEHSLRTGGPTGRTEVYTGRTHAEACDKLLYVRRLVDARARKAATAAARDRIVHVGDSSWILRAEVR